MLAGAAIGDYAALSARLRPAQLIVCADSGVRHARPLGVTPTAIVGDFDSASEADIAAWRAAGIEIVRFPAAKDETDTELALRHAVSRGARQIDLAGATGSRLDHSLANLLLLPPLVEAGIEVALLDPYNEVRLCRDRVQVDGQAGDLLSLLPLTPEVAGVTTVGLLYPLRGETLRWGSARGVSNVLTGPRAEVAVASGWLAVIAARD